MRPWADLHTHTHYSDGADAPEEVAERAAKLGMSMWAVTDHDTTAGLAQAREAALSHGIRFLDGVEISAQFERHEVHVVGLGIDSSCPELQALLTRLETGRRTRAERIAAKLSKHGHSVDLDNLGANDAALGRMHIARSLHAQGVVKSVQEAFDRFLNPGRPAYVPKERATCMEALAAIHASGGLAFVAHPGIGSLRKALPSLIVLPFDGIEAYHSKHSPGHTEGFITLAKEQGLLISGGSDCHGRAKGQRPDMGTVRMPLAYAEAIAAELGS